MPKSPLHFTRLYLPRPLDPIAVEHLLTRLTAKDTPRPLVFEVRAKAGEITYLIGHSGSQAGRIRQLLRHQLPDIGFGKPTPRDELNSAGRLTVRPPGLPVNTSNTETTVSSLYGVLAGLRKDERFVLQTVLGRGHHPATLPSDTIDPTRSSLADLLLHGTRPAPTEIRRRLGERVGQPRLDITVRVGVAAEAADRRTELAMQLLGSLQGLESPGVRLDLTREPTHRLDRALVRRRPIELTPAELVPFLIWPVGEAELPGIESLHPRRIPAPAQLSKTESVFAISTAAGTCRRVGITPEARLKHWLITGPTGSGKSLVFANLILSDIAAGRACVVVEPKRQLVDYIINHAPEDAAGRIVVLDAADSEPVGFNPLDVGDRDPEIAVDGILAALGAVFEEGWGPRTEYLIQGALLTLARAGTAGEMPYTLVDLPRLFTNARFRHGVVATVNDDPRLAEFWAEYEDLRPGQRAAMIAAPLNKLRKLVLRKNLVAVLGQPQPRFRLRDVFREDKTVLVPLNDALLGTGAATLLGSLIVAELWMATLERAAEKEPTKRPGMVFVDEVQNYLHLPTSIADALATSRSYGVAWHLAHQYRAQLTPAMRSAFDINARSKVCFALGADDARDMARISAVLTPQDFQSLPPYEVYANLVDGAAPTGWFSARTLEPEPETGHGALIREASRCLYGAAPTPLETAESDVSDAPHDPTLGTHRKARRP